jgi:predicted  nucleic acid-binding Zn-ribbon protein
MSSRGRPVQFPRIVRKSDHINDGAVEIAPGIVATSHEAEQQFWQGQTSHMQKLATSAAAKKKYQSEIKTMKNNLKAARSELRDIKDQFNAVLSKTDGMIMKSKNVSKTEEQPQAETWAEVTTTDGSLTLTNVPKETSAHIEDGKSKAIAELQDRIAQLETDLATVTVQRAELQDDVNASDASLTDITNKFTECHNELEDIKATVSIWQAAIDQGRLQEEAHLHTIGELRSQLAKSKEALAAEQAQNKSTSEDLEGTSEALDLTVSALETSESKLRDLHAEYDALEHERTAAAATHTNLVYAVRAKDVELAETKHELRAARDKVAELEERRVVLGKTGGEEQVVASTRGATAPDLQHMKSSTVNSPKTEFVPSDSFSKLTLTSPNYEENRQSNNNSGETKSATLNFGQSHTFHVSNILGKRLRTVTDIGRTVDELSTTGEESQFPEEEYEEFLRDLESSSSTTKTSSSRATKAGDSDAVTTAKAMIEQAVTERQPSSVNPTVSEPTPLLTSPSNAIKDEEKLSTSVAVGKSSTPATVEMKPVPGDWRTLPVTVASSSPSMRGLKPDKSASSAVDTNRTVVQDSPKPLPAQPKLPQFSGNMMNSRWAPRGTDTGDDAHADGDGQRERSGRGRQEIGRRSDRGRSPRAQTGRGRDGGTYRRRPE